MDARSSWRKRSTWAVALLLATAAGTARAGDEAADLLSRIGRIRTLDGAPAASPPQPGGATVLIFYSTECPIANAVNPTLNALVEAFPPPRVRWIGVCEDPDLTDADVAAHAREYGLKFAVAADRRGRLAREIGATVTPEAFVVDERGLVRYHGRIDDQFAGRGVRKANPGPGDLKLAVAAVLAGEEPKSAFVKAVGCPLPEPSTPTYAKDVAPILQQNCRECHRKGQVGPFALDEYEQARKRAGDLATVVEARTMPPWKAAPGVGPKFRHDRSLSSADVETVVAWAEAGAPEGDFKDLPAAKEFSEDWSMEGGPDLVLDIGTDFAVPASGDDLYRCFVLATDLPEDVYISGVEYRPGNPRVVHHVLGYVDDSGDARKKDEAEAGPGYTCFSGPSARVRGDLGGWAPGAAPSVLADGVGRSLPSKADVVVQVHYHPSGKPEVDRTRIGLKLARKPVKQTLHWNGAFNFDLDLPPGESNVEVRAEWTVPVDVEAWAVAPHMHRLGRDMAMSVTFPDGRTRDLIRIDDWDFGWQSQYYFDEPMDLPRGSVVRAVAHFDNSASNPRNPNRDAPRRVRWGEATTDEMCIGFIAVTKKGQDLTRPGEADDLREIFERQQDREGR